MTEEQEKFLRIKKTKSADYTTVGEDIQYKVFADTERKEVVLQFEESSSRRDWLHNLQWIPWPLRLGKGKMTVWTTRGFACAYRSTFWKDGCSVCVEELYRKCFEPEFFHFKTAIRGWSFGSAMAKIAVRDFFLTYGIKVSEVTTYGDVKCWLNPLLKRRSKKWADTIREYGCINDFVTWGIPLFHRTHRCRVGGKFGFKKILETEYTHTHYEEYDYSKYEKKVMSRRRR